MVASFVLAGGSIGTSSIAQSVGLSVFEDVNERVLADEAGLLEQAVEVVLVVAGGVVRGDFVDVVVQFDRAFVDQDRVDGSVGVSEVQDGLDFRGNREFGFIERPGHRVDF